MICVTTISDTVISELAETVIHVELEYRSYVDRMTPILYISEFIVKHVAKLDKEASIKYLKRFEGFAKENKIFLRMDDKFFQQESAG